MHAGSVLVPMARGMEVVIMGTLARRIRFCSSILVALVANACSPAPDSISSAGGDAADAEPDFGFVFETDPVDSGIAAEDSGALDTAPSCMPSGDADDPDDEFKDSNCDGIDGDKSKAVFVSPDGSDEAAGTMDKPLKTLTAAVERATKDGKDIYACNATYGESLSISSAVRIFGGYDCKAAWKRTLDRATIAPGSGVAVKIAGASARVRLDRLVLRSADASDPGQSSIAIFAVNADSVEVTGSLVEAGKGANGVTPPTATTVTTPATKGMDGTSRYSQTCRYDGTCGTTFCFNTCTQTAIGGRTTPPTGSCESPGGKGGTGPGGPSSSTPFYWSKAADSGMPGSPSALGGTVPPSRGAGNPGRPGTAGRNGDSSSRVFGTINETGYVADNAGSDGEVGTAGGGGGGGWSGSMGPIDVTKVAPEYFFVGGGGGEGGFGGCGGTGGKGGGGGGASIGIVAFKTKLTLKRTTITTAGGGAGGNGGGGADGQLGGAGGKGGTTSAPGYAVAEAGNAHDGGSGGKGGKGGAGGGGGGGPSIGVAHNGDAPIVDSVTFNIASGGKGGSSPGGTDAADGKVAADGIYRFGE